MASLDPASVAAQNGRLRVSCERLKRQLRHTKSDVSALETNLGHAHHTISELNETQVLLRKRLDEAHKVIERHKLNEHRLDKSAAKLSRALHSVMKHKQTSGMLGTTTGSRFTTLLSPVAVSRSSPTTSRSAPSGRRPASSPAGGRRPKSSPTTRKTTDPLPLTTTQEEEVLSSGAKDLVSILRRQVSLATARMRQMEKDMTAATNRFKEMEATIGYLSTAQAAHSRDLLQQQRAVEVLIAQRKSLIHELHDAAPERLHRYIPPALDGMDEKPVPPALRPQLVADTMNEEVARAKAAVVTPDDDGRGSGSGSGGEVGTLIDIGTGDATSTLRSKVSVSKGGAPPDSGSPPLRRSTSRPRSNSHRSLSGVGGSVSRLTPRSTVGGGSTMAESGISVDPLGQLTQRTVDPEAGLRAMVHAECGTYLSALRLAASFQALADAQSRIASTSTPTAFVTALKTEARGLLCASAVRLFRERFGRLEEVLPVGGRHVSIPDGKGLVGWVASTGKRLRVTDAYADPRFRAAVEDGSVDATFRTRNFLGVPIVAQTPSASPSDPPPMTRHLSASSGKSASGEPEHGEEGRAARSVVGVLVAVNKNNLLDFTRHDQILLSMLACQALPVMLQLAGESLN